MCQLRVEGPGAAMAREATGTLEAVMMFIRGYRCPIGNVFVNLVPVVVDAYIYEAVNSGLKLKSAWRFSASTQLASPQSLLQLLLCTCCPLLTASSLTILFCLFSFLLTPSQSSSPVAPESNATSPKSHNHRNDQASSDTSKPSDVKVTHSRMETRLPKRKQ